MGNSGWVLQFKIDQRRSHREGDILIKELKEVRDARKNILGRGKSKCKVLKLDLTVVFSKEQEGAVVLEWSK